MNILMSKIFKTGKILFIEGVLLFIPKLNLLNKFKSWIAILLCEFIRKFLADLWSTHFSCMEDEFVHVEKEYEGELLQCFNFAIIDPQSKKIKEIRKWLKETCNDESE